MKIKRIIILIIIVASVLAAIYMRPQAKHAWYRFYYTKIEKLNASKAEQKAQHLFDKQKYPEAAELSANLLRAFPASARLHRIRGLSLYLSGSHLEGAKYLFPFLNNSDEDAGIVQHIASSLFEEQYYRDVITLLEKIPPGRDPALNYYLGASLVETGDFRKAIAHLEKSEARGSNNSDVYFYLGRAHEKLGDEGEALNQYKQALRINPFHRRAKKSLVELYTRKGMYREAERLIRGRP